MVHSLSISHAALVLLLLLATTARAQRAEELDLDTLPSGAASEAPVPDLDQVAQQIVAQTNVFRKSEDLQPLTTNETLKETAQDFADFMARTSKYGHYADGKSPAQRASEHNYDYCIVLENIAYRYSSQGFSADELASGFVTGWKNSKGHRKNMLDPAVTETAVAVAHSKESGNFFAVQLFGRPQSAAIEFQVANMTSEALQYSVTAQQPRDSESNQSETANQSDTGSPFEIPPRAIMTHQRCRPSQIHFQWMMQEKVIQPEGGMKYTVRQGADGSLEVARAETDTQ